MREPESRLPPEDVIRARVKVELRKRLRGLRATTPLDACAKRSARIVSSLESLEVFAKARRVALFWPIVERKEVDLRALDATLRARGVDVAYPSIDPDTREMTFRFAPPGSLEERGLGFCEPPADAREASPGELDVLVVPAIAIDERGHRIGYGAGFYDRTLPTFAPPAVAIGVAYDFQLVVEVPAAPHDVPLAIVVTDERVIEVASST
jgi:5-formyltetrahydrofolate cyclo-ligase